eukprot:CAMPEP_0119570392 /NCGR_PEP_ID=MMETSP1352-20130426/43593_1 /TAXON_ID=265584 /ORGANISM="Stauroneis constricta, Strain CCMP1120" /LENGTH=475 /DNA_ID=CAMNT_0007620061 /DNA_START=394 /DNA_END=1819 /DNA_ORIENTATION=-
MSKPFDYSKWDKIELSDDEEDVHPNIDKESWFRMKHRSRVEREEHEEKDRRRINEEMSKANQRIKMLRRDLQKIEKRKAADDDDSEDEEDLDDTEAIKIEIQELEHANKQRQAKLDEYDKNKKWNVDNMFEVKEERTVINPSAGKSNYTPSGFAESTVTGEEVKKEFEEKTKAEKVAKKEAKEGGGEESEKSKAASKPAAKSESTSSTAVVSASPSKKAVVAGPAKPKPSAAAAPSREDTDSTFVYSYHEFTEKYADLVEEFMAIREFSKSREFLMQHGTILLQEHASNYLLLASLEDEMNGLRDKMKQTSKQCQIISNITELAKSWGTHPGNVIIPFFQRMEQREFLEGFISGVDAFVQKIISRAVTKKMEIDAQRRSGVSSEGVDLQDIPREERLGPGGLDPLEVIESLPVEMQEAFESRDIDELRNVLMKMDPKDAEYHMKDASILVFGTLRADEACANLTSVTQRNNDRTA